MTCAVLGWIQLAQKRAQRWREKHRMRTLDNVVVRNVFGSKREEVDIRSSSDPAIVGLI
jgi:hypothetical protein